MDKRDLLEERRGGGGERAARRSRKAETPLRIGRIVSISGASALVQLDRKDLDADAADPQESAPSMRPKSPQIGNLVRVETDIGFAYAIISGLQAPHPAIMDDLEELWIAEVELMGEAQRDASGELGRFRRGVSAYPTLGAAVEAATRNDLQRAYSLGEDDPSVTVGALQQDPSVPVMIKVDEMLGKHFAILGSTGTGKSCSVALVLRSILEQYPHAHALLLDAHGEYAASFGALAEVITHRDLRLPFWILTHEELSKVLLGDQLDYSEEAELLGDLVRQAKAIHAARPAEGADPSRFRRAADISAFSADTPSPYLIADLLRAIDERMGSLEHQGALATHRRLRARLDARIRDNRYEFMFGPDAAATPLADVLQRLFRLPVAGKPLAILELSGLPSEVLSVIVSVSARLAYDFAIRNDGGVALTLICEEAHNYIPANAAHGFEPARRAIARIAKEGRKYGCSIGIVTQRPSELDPTILSQCNTVFSLRLANELDQQLVRAAVSDAAAGLMRFLPSLATGEAIAFGDGVALPMRLRFKLLASELRPGGRQPRFSESWVKDDVDRAHAERVVGRWRAPRRDDPEAESSGAAAPPEAPPRDRDRGRPAPRVQTRPADGPVMHPTRRWGDKERT
ncbi:MAG: DUF87 domain-containing protein [Pseudomonadota bacterium]